jgi:AraC-like DNA-binding protein/quercetin dioxygenase-like cupin family protein
MPRPAPLPPEIADPPAAGYTRYDRGELPLQAMAVDYASGHVTRRHQHPHAQLIHAVRGVMLVATDAGQWLVPPTRGIWMPAETDHWIRMIGEVHMRTAYIRPDALAPQFWNGASTARELPAAPGVLGISPLLRELIVAAIPLPLPYTADSRAGRLVRLLLDELLELPTLPLSLPKPRDPRLQRICEALSRSPDDASTLGDWAERLHLDPKTIQRLFARDTGMSFGQWRQQARLLTALERLAQGQKVLNVALELGYSSPSAFATMFRKQFGVPPGSFFNQADSLTDAF